MTYSFNIEKGVGMKTFLKKIGAFLTAGAMLTVTAGNLCACSQKETISVGSFLNKTASAFGMANYTATEPYFANIDSSNVYYEVVQMAGDRNAFAEYSSLDLEEPLTQEMAALVLVNVSDMTEYCEKDNNVKIRNKNKLLNEEKINIAVSNDLFELSSFDSSFKKDKKLSETEATNAIDKAVEIWAGREYEDALEYEVADDVIDLSQGDNAISVDDFYYIPDEDSPPPENEDTSSDEIDSSGEDDASGENNSSGIVNSAVPVNDVVLSPELSKQILDSGESNINDSSEPNSITLPDGTKLSEGDTYLLPATENEPIIAYVIEEITEDEDGNIRINNTAVEDNAIDSDMGSISVSSAVENFHESKTITAEEINLLDYDIRDGNGNLIKKTENNGQSDSSTTPVSDSYTYNNNNNIVPLGNYTPLQNTSDDLISTPLSNGWEGSIEFEDKNSGFKVKGTIGSNSVSCSLEYTKEDDDDKVKRKRKASFEVSDLAVRYDVQQHVFKLKKAELVVDYKTKTSFEASREYEKEPVDLKYTMGSEKFLQNLNNLGKDKKDDKTITICKIPIVSAGVVSIELVLKVKISIEGSISIIIEEKHSKGFKYENKNFNIIDTKEHTPSVEAKGKVEVTAGIGASLNALAMNICELDVEGGIGCEASLTTYLIDENNRLYESLKENVPPDIADIFKDKTFASDIIGGPILKLDSCFDITTYWILKISISRDCLLGKLGVKFEKEIFNKDNAKIDKFSGHWEGGKYIGKKCTKDYEEATEEETTASATENNTINTYAPEDKEAPSFKKEDFGNEELKKPLSATMYLNMSIGESSKIEITSLPDGYNTSDIIFTSENEDIVSVGSDGTVSAKSEGTTIIHIKTSDNQFETACTVIVKMNS